MTAALAIVGAGAWFVGSRGPDLPTEPARVMPEDVTGRVGHVIAALAVAIVFATWIGRTIAALRHGMETVDTLWYHMPAAARFVQTASTTHLHYFDADPVTVFYPATSPLLHGFGIQLLGNDLLSPLMNLGWLALALVAGWAIGEAYGVGPVSVTGVAIVASTPGMVTTQPGGSYTDIVGLAVVLSAIALLVHGARAATDRGPTVAIAALAAGVAVGTKLTMLAPVGALVIVVAAAASWRRSGERGLARDFGNWCLLLFVAGGYFFVRNIVHVGNPLPSLSFGPLDLPTPPVPTPTFTVAQYLFRGSIWHHYYLPGLWDSLGPAWWAALAVAMAATALLFARSRSPLERWLGIVPLVSLIGFLVTPQFLGVVDHPVFFVYNVRYLTPTLGAGLCLAPTLPALGSRVPARVLQLALFAILVATQWGSQIWAWSVAPNPLRVTERILFVDIVGAVIAGLVIAAVGIGLVYLRPRLPARPIVASALAFVVVGGYPLQEAYLRHRYTTTPPMPHIYEWAQDQHDQRIAVIGTDLQYPLYGKDLTNYVQYIGKQGPHGAYTPITTCRAWRDAIDTGHYGWIVIAPAGFPAARAPRLPREQLWTRSDPHAHLVRTDVHPGYGTAVLFRIDGRLDPNGC